MKLGITGASGFIGSYLIRKLLESDPSFTCLALDMGDLPRDLAGNRRVRFIPGDLLSQPVCEEFLSGIDTVIHLGQTSNPVTSNLDWVADVQEGIIPTLNLLDVMRRMKREYHVIFPSSGGTVYAPSGNGVPRKETDPLLSETSYGIQKIALENYLSIAAKSGLIRATVLRIANPYGVLLPAYRKQGFMGVALQRILNGEPVRIFGDPNNVRDYIHLDDLVNAFSAALNRRGSFYDVFNIGSGTGHSVRDILGLIENGIGRPLELQYVSQEGAEALPSHVILDITKARNKLGWKSVIPLETGLMRLIQEAGLAV